VSRKFTRGLIALGDYVFRKGTPAHWWEKQASIICVLWCDVRVMMMD
jgi:hypothetical protein